MDPADHSGLETSEAETGGEEEEKPVATPYLRTVEAS